MVTMSWYLGAGVTVVQPEWVLGCPPHYLLIPQVKSRLLERTNVPLLTAWSGGRAAGRHFGILKKVICENFIRCVLFTLDSMAFILPFMSAMLVQFRHSAWRRDTGSQDGFDHISRNIFTTLSVLHCHHTSHRALIMCDLLHVLMIFFCPKISSQHSGIANFYVHLDSLLQKAFSVIQNIPSVGTF